MIRKQKNKRAGKNISSRLTAEKLCEMDCRPSLWGDRAPGKRGVAGKGVYPWPASGLDRETMYALRDRQQRTGKAINRQVAEAVEASLDIQRIFHRVRCCMSDALTSIEGVEIMLASVQTGIRGGMGAREYSNMRSMLQRILDHNLVQATRAITDIEEVLVLSVNK